MRRIRSLHALSPIYCQIDFESAQNTHRCGCSSNNKRGGERAEKNQIDHNSNLALAGPSSSHSGHSPCHELNISASTDSRDGEAMGGCVALDRDGVHVL